MEHEESFWEKFERWLKLISDLIIILIKNPHVWVFIALLLITFLLTGS